MSPVWDMVWIRRLGLATWGTGVCSELPEPELKGREIPLQASQPELEGEAGEKRQAAAPHLHQETGCLELGVSSSYLLSSQM